MSNPKPIKEQLVDLFNVKLVESGIEAEYVEADLTFAAPTAYDAETIDLNEPESANTFVLVTAGEGLTEVQYNLHYCRLDLAHLVSLREDFFAGSIAAGTTAHDLLDELSEAFGFPVTVDDVEDTALTNVTAEDATLVVTAKATSLSFTGTVAVTVLAP
jgi:hypothetical protein